MIKMATSLIITAVSSMECALVLLLRSLAVGERLQPLITIFIRDKRAPLNFYIFFLRSKKFFAAFHLFHLCLPECLLVFLREFDLFVCVTCRPTGEMMDPPTCNKVSLSANHFIILCYVQSNVALVAK